MLVVIEIATAPECASYRCMALYNCQPLFDDHFLIPLRSKHLPDDWLERMYHSCQHRHPPIPETLDHPEMHPMLMSYLVSHHACHMRVHELCMLGTCMHVCYITSYNLISVSFPFQIPAACTHVHVHVTLSCTCLAHNPGMYS